MTFRTCLRYLGLLLLVPSSFPLMYSCEGGTIRSSYKDGSVSMDSGMTDTSTRDSQDRVSSNGNDGRFQPKDSIDAAQEPSDKQDSTTERSEGTAQHCLPNPCRFGGKCEEQEDGYNCICKEGFEGLNCESNLNDCLTNTCRNGGECRDRIDSYVCICPIGFGGLHCENNLTGCEDNPCLNGGICSATDLTYSCQCLSGFEGTHCELKSVSCGSDPCENGTCIEEADGTNCDCTGTGYEGQWCEIPIDNCPQSNPCNHGGRCVSTPQGYNCNCAGTGYTGRTCDTEINSDFVQEPLSNQATAVLLHHSTGDIIYTGAWSSPNVTEEISSYNQTNGTSYQVGELWYPSEEGYGNSNDPYDYWNLWVNDDCVGSCHSEQTLDELTSNYDVIVFKHCFPASEMVDSSSPADPSSNTKSTQNYSAQYNALKELLHEYPSNRFILWTFPALLDDGRSESAISAELATSFAQWVKDTWDEPGDNIFIFDFRRLETGGGNFAIPANVRYWGGDDHHPNESFAHETAPKLVKRIVDVIEGNGDSTSLTGE